MSQKVLYLIGGPNGSGKSTLVRQIGLPNQMDFLNADDIAVEIGAKDCRSAGRVLTKRIHHNLDTGKSLAVESTIAGRAHLSIMRDARQMGFGIIMLYTFNEKVEDNLQRTKQRFEGGGHFVPESDVIYRFEKSLAHFNETSALADVWQVYYTGVSSVYAPVVRSIFGEVQVQDETKYAMFKNRIR